MKSAWSGSLGAVFAALCCAGAPAVLGALTAAGLGVLINDAILLPLVVLALGVALWGLWRGTVRHRLRGVLVLGSLGALLLVVGIFLSPLLVYVGGGGDVGRGGLERCGTQKRARIGMEVP